VQEQHFPPLVHSSLLPAAAAAPPILIDWLIDRSIDRYYNILKTKQKISRPIIQAQKLSLGELSSGRSNNNNNSHRLYIYHPPP
jgi:hypothetical protein